MMLALGGKVQPSGFKMSLLHNEMIILLARKDDQYTKLGGSSLYIIWKPAMQSFIMDNSIGDTCTIAPYLGRIDGGDIPVNR